MNSIKRCPLVAACVFAACVFAACGGSATMTAVTPPATIPLTEEVSADPSLVFTPGTVTIQRGGSVVIDFGPVAHNVFFDNQPAGAPPNVDGTNANVSKSLSFSTAGTFVYNCHIHPGMHGTVVVVARTPPP